MTEGPSRSRASLRRLRLRPSPGGSLRPSLLPSPTLPPLPLILVRVSGLPRPLGSDRWFLGSLALLGSLVFGLLALLGSLVFELLALLGSLVLGIPFVFPVGLGGRLYVM